MDMLLITVCVALFSLCSPHNTATALISFVCVCVSLAVITTLLHMCGCGCGGGCGGVGVWGGGMLTARSSFTYGVPIIVIATHVCVRVRVPVCV